MNPTLPGDNTRIAIASLGDGTAIPVYQQSVLEGEDIDVLLAKRSIQNDLGFPVAIQNPDVSKKYEVRRISDGTTSDIVALLYVSDNLRQPSSNMGALCAPPISFGGDRKMKELIFPEATKHLGSVPSDHGTIAQFVQWAPRGANLQTAQMVITNVLGHEVVIADGETLPHLVFKQEDHSRPVAELHIIVEYEEVIERLRSIF